MGVDPKLKIITTVNNKGKLHTKNVYGLHMCVSQVFLKGSRTPPGDSEL